ncbi:MAG: Ig-like domain-containing protein, partial [Thermoplasmata archaeon]
LQYIPSTITELLLNASRYTKVRLSGCRVLDNPSLFSLIVCQNNSTIDVYSETPLGRYLQGSYVDIAAGVLSSSSSSKPYLVIRNREGDSIGFSPRTTRCDYILADIQTILSGCSDSIYQIDRAVVLSSDGKYSFRVSEPVLPEHAVPLRVFISPAALNIPAGYSIQAGDVLTLRGKYLSEKGIFIVRNNGLDSASLYESFSSPVYASLSPSALIEKPAYGFFSVSSLRVVSFQQDEMLVGIDGISERIHVSIEDGAAIPDVLLPDMEVSLKGRMVFTNSALYPWTIVIRAGTADCIEYSRCSASYSLTTLELLVQTLMEGFFNISGIEVAGNFTLLPDGTRAFPVKPQGYEGNIGPPVILCIEPSAAAPSYLEAGMILSAQGRFFFSENLNASVLRIRNLSADILQITSYIPRPDVVSLRDVQGNVIAGFILPDADINNSTSADFNLRVYVFDQLGNPLENCTVSVIFNSTILSNHTTNPAGYAAITFTLSLQRGEASLTLIIRCIYLEHQLEEVYPVIRGENQGYIPGS